MFLKTIKINLQSIQDVKKSFKYRHNKILRVAKHTSRAGPISQAKVLGVIERQKKRSFIPIFHKKGRNKASPDDAEKCP